MRVLYVCADRGIPLLGNKGASVHVRSITSALSRLGHEVIVVVRAMGSGNQPPEVAEVVELPPDQEDAERRLGELMIGRRTDIVIERYSLDSGSARRAASLVGLPLLLEVNAPLVEEARRFRGLVDPAADGRELEVLAGADHIQVVSQALCEMVHTRVPQVPCTWIPNGVDLELFRHVGPAPLEGTENGLVVGFVGSMKPWHGVECLLEAFCLVRNTVSDAVLVLVGGGPLEEMVSTRAVELGIGDAVVLPGAVPHQAVPGLVKSFDVAVAPYAPSGDFYFSPLKVLEYMAAGVPVVYSDLGDLATVVGDAGIGVPAGNPTALAGELVALLGDRQRRHVMGSVATTRAELFGWEATADRMAELATNLIATFGQRVR